MDPINLPIKTAKPPQLLNKAAIKPQKMK